jgi:hypothetical protein
VKFETTITVVVRFEAESFDQGLSVARKLENGVTVPAPAGHGAELVDTNSRLRELL